MYKIVFAGTPDFAVPSLQACLESSHEVCAVYTQKDRPKGRGQILTPSPIKELAESADIPVHTPLNFKDPDVIATLNAYKPDLIIVVAYGMILPQSVLDIPVLTCLNVHASLLPRWRGAAPINHALMAGDSDTGVSIMQLVAKLDAGAVYHKATCAIKKTDTAADLYNALAVLGAEALRYTLDVLLPQQYIPIEQDQAKVTYAHKLSKVDGRVNFSLSATQIMLNFRGLQPWPGCYFTHGKLQIKVHAMLETGIESGLLPGTIISWGESGLELATATYNIIISKLQLPGKKAVYAKDLYCGQPSLFSVNKVVA